MGGMYGVLGPWVGYAYLRLGELRRWMRGRSFLSEGVVVLRLNGILWTVG